MDEKFALESAHAKFPNGSSWLLPFEKRMFLYKTFWKRNATLLTTPTSYVRACSYGGEALTDTN